MGPKPAERSSTAPGTPRIASRFLTIVFVLGAGGCATTGSIRGTFALPPSIAVGDTAMIVGGVPKIPPGSVTNAVAFVLDDPGSKPRPADRSKRECVRQTPAGFEPSVIVISVGTTVAFENCDSIYHSAFSVAKANPFDTDLYAPGQKRAVLFARPGVVNVYCELHPQSAAVVVVLPHRLYARPNARGEFHLPRLAEGTYTVQAWHPIYGETSARVKVPHKGNPTVRLAF